MDELQLKWLRELKLKEGHPVVAWIENDKDRYAVGQLRRNGFIERRGYSESGMSTYYYVTEKGNQLLLDEAQ